MPATSKVKLSGLEVATDIGTYGPGDVVPRAHILDLELTIDASLVLIEADGMDRVFDYDPLIADIDRIARDGHYHTQERVMSRIARACAAYPPIRAVEITLSKTPVLGDTGTLGVTLTLDPPAFEALRNGR